MSNAGGAALRATADCLNGIGGRVFLMTQSPPDTGAGAISAKREEAVLYGGDKECQMYQPAADVGKDVEAVATGVFYKALAKDCASRQVRRDDNRWKEGCGGWGVRGWGPLVISFCGIERLNIAEFVGFISSGEVGFAFVDTAYVEDAEGRKKMSHQHLKGTQARVTNISRLPKNSFDVMPKYDARENDARQCVAAHRKM